MNRRQVLNWDGALTPQLTRRSIRDESPSCTLPHFRLDIDRDWNVLWRKPVVDAEPHQPALLKGSCCTSAYRQQAIRPPL
jgi:hypothetical protein